jgi:hypothetical protein
VGAHTEGATHKPTVAEVAQIAELRSAPVGGCQSHSLQAGGREGANSEFTIHNSELFAGDV